ncbi:MAG: phosphonoacetate hydrolase [Proteobacteria bacterium]|nr:phosphonoacetate hydrolase [Pseudomonadota bacterium]
MTTELSAPTMPTLEVNGRSYRWPKRPTVVVCFDGCDPSYLAAASAAGVIPVLDRMQREGFSAIALAAMPTFTNPNNVSIVCGVPPAVHGVSGNFYIDRDSGREVMMVDATPMRAPTLLSAFSQAGAKVAAVTAKDKLRRALGHDLKGIAFSAEKADATTQAEHGIADVTALIGRAAPDQYSADLSLFVLDAGVRLLETRRPDLMYLSLSDYVQHKHAPEEAEALAFMAAVDARLGQLIAAGAVVGIVADHGMTDMAKPDGTPNVLYVGDALDAAFGAGAMRVVCPITDPFVRHHGALGGFVRVHLMASGRSPDEVAGFVRTLPGVAVALTRDEACARFDLPADREGDVAVIADKGVALGARAVDHDVSQLAGTRLRSHGGLFEQPVPFILSRPLREDAGASPQPLRNFDIFALALNAVEA